MKNIIIGTDFSDASNNAFEYGVRLAEHWQAKVTLIHAYDLLSPAMDTGPLFSPEEMKEDAENQLTAAIKSLPFKTQISITPQAVLNDATNALLNAAVELEDSLVVVGMKGRGKAFRRLFGSTATALARLCKRPVLAIPETFKFTPITTLAFATDINHSTNLHVLDPMIKLGEKFNASAYLIRIIQKEKDELVEWLFRPSGIKWYLRNLHPSFVFAHDRDVAHALNKFVETQHVNLLCMLSHEHNLIERLVLKNNIKDVLFSANVPLLILPARPDSPKFIASTSLRKTTGFPHRSN